MLSGAFEWAVSQLPSRDAIADHHFGDFINVTPGELTEHLIKTGMPPNRVNLIGQPGFATYPVPAKWNVSVETNGTYSVFYEDEHGAGRTSLTDTAPTSMRAVAALIATKIYDEAILELTHCFRNKHFPEVVPLPAAGKAWPDGVVRY